MTWAGKTLILISLYGTTQPGAAGVCLRRQKPPQIPPLSCQGRVPHPSRSEGWEATKTDWLEESHPKRFVIPSGLQCPPPLHPVIPSEGCAAAEVEESAVPGAPCLAFETWDPPPRFPNWPAPNIFCVRSDNIWRRMADCVDIMWISGDELAIFHADNLRRK